MKTFKQYQEETIRTLALLETKEDDITHMLQGMSTEVGELTDPFKKKLAYKKEVDYQNVKEEIGDLLWYISNLCNILDFDMGELADANIKKLMKRYPDKFTEEKALNRNIKHELNHI